MTSLRRWIVVALVAAIAVATPQVVRAWPVSDSDVSAAQLFEQVQDSGDRAYSGYVESTGTVKLPVGNQFSDLGALFGEQSRLRVWWRSDDAWRVDRLEATGESDLVHDRRYTTTYDYADARATTSVDPGIRLPRASDLIPPLFARVVLSGITADEVSRLPARRVAGIDAPGLRVDPTSAQTTIDHVDLWIDPTTGLPLRLEVYGTGSTAPAFTTAFASFSAATPDADRVAFSPTDGVHGDFEDALDIADAANQYAPVRPPDVVAGLRRASTRDGRGAVGIYGDGVTRILAVPLRDQDADSLRQQLAKVPDAVVADDSTDASVGPLGVRVTGRSGDSGWLVAGTVTTATLASAAHDLETGTVYVGDRR